MEYPPEIDLASLPRSIQLLPAVYAIAPLAWAAGGRYSLEGLDERTAAALGLLRAELRRVNPAASWSGEVVAPNPVRVAPLPKARSEAGLLFSTGVDSTSTAIQHRAEALVLISVGLDDDQPVARWRADMAEAERFAAASGKPHVVVRTNARSFVDRAIDQRQPSLRPWWPKVAHGMALCGAGAPVVFRYGAARLYIAATHGGGFERPWGSTPRLDPLIAIGDAAVIHDGYERSRFARVQTVVAGSGDDGIPFALRVCHHVTQGARNCGVCEKCVRTQIAIILAGGDPRQHGFPSYDASVSLIARDALETLRWPLDGGLVVYWQELIAASRQRDAGLPSHDADLEWLNRLDLSGYIKQRLVRGRARRRRRALRRLTHGVGRRLRRLAPDS